MRKTTKYRQTVAFILVKQNRFLAEKRKKTKRIDPGLWAIPGGGIKANESPEQATRREAKEELGISIRKAKFLCTLIYEHPEYPLLMHYFLTQKWQGKIQVHEAEKLAWLPISKSQKLGAYVDRQAMRIFKENKRRVF